MKRTKNGCACAICSVSWNSFFFYFHYHDYVYQENGHDLLSVSLCWPPEIVLSHMIKIYTTFESIQWGFRMPVSLMLIDFYFRVFFMTDSLCVSHMHLYDAHMLFIHGLTENSFFRIFHTFSSIWIENSIFWESKYKRKYRDVPWMRARKRDISFCPSRID